MAASYRGMDRLGAIVEPLFTQGASSSGHSIRIQIEEYELHGVFPDWQEIPTEKKHIALLTVHKIAHGASAFIKPADAEECEDHGGMKSVGANCWRLTEA
jgi:hypothetical protein